MLIRSTQKYPLEAYETFSMEYATLLLGRAYRRSSKLTSLPFFSVPSIMLAWGLVMTLMCLVNSYHGLIMFVFSSNEQVSMVGHSSDGRLQSSDIPWLGRGRSFPRCDVLYLALVRASFVWVL